MNILESQIQTARKEHRCALCGDKIKVGTKYHYWKGTEGADLYTTKTHLECNNVLLEYFAECCDCNDDEWTTEMVMEYVNDALRDEGIEPANYVHDAVLQYMKMKGGNE